MIFHIIDFGELLRRVILNSSALLPIVDQVKFVAYHDHWDALFTSTGRIPDLGDPVTQVFERLLLSQVKD